uniref:Uncharacterized protein n=1 Tax=Vitrella brassicaformis TaxID=1169539 RepID=A0A6U4HBT8_9ALVE|mmetsp:Transcript_46400/g.115435  ORF Transcript_46400/g.115435 Transcript_46400/m.115435 type:complete len:771 (+) Transcript_46400:105-2417(+)
MTSARHISRGSSLEEGRPLTADTSSSTDHTSLSLGIDDSSSKLHRRNCMAGICAAKSGRTRSIVGVSCIGVLLCVGAFLASRGSSFQPANMRQDGQQVISIASSRRVAQGQHRLTADSGDSFLPPQSSAVEQPKDEAITDEQEDDADTDADADTSADQPPAGSAPDDATKSDQSAASKTEETASSSGEVAVVQEGAAVVERDDAAKDTVAQASSSAAAAPAPAVKEEPPKSSPHLEVLDGSIEVVWEAPPGGPSRGVVFLAHGCHHSATDFWPKSPGCERCLGLPEERQMVREMLSEGYGVVAISSANRQRMCWHFEQDGKRVLKALEILRHREGWESLPLFAVGASSGGGLIGSLIGSKELVDRGLKFDAVAVQIMAIVLHDEMLDKYPPVLFISMSKDKATTRVVRGNIEGLRERQRPALLLSVKPHPITPKFFSDRIPEIDEELSGKLHKALRDKQLIDEDGFLKENPRDSHRCPWRELFDLTVTEIKDRGISLTADESAISEELNIAWASHEITAEFTKETLDWFASRGDMSKLKKRDDGTDPPLLTYIADHNIDPTSIAGTKPQQPAADGIAAVQTDTDTGRDGGEQQQQPEQQQQDQQQQPEQQQQKEPEAAAAAAETTAKDTDAEAEKQATSGEEASSAAAGAAAETTADGEANNNAPQPPPAPQQTPTNVTDSVTASNQQQQQQPEVSGGGGEATAAESQGAGESAASSSSSGGDEDLKKEITSESDQAPEGATGSEVVETVGEGAVPQAPPAPAAPAAAHT